jgi:S-adenosyl-L-methionine hydrolase (adenosine-forming)
MSVITLTTDWNTNDYYLAAFKGCLFSMNVEEPVVEISHRVSTHNLQQAAFILKHSFRYFPEGSIHVIGVLSQPAPEKNYLIASACGHYFICADNAVVSLIFPDEPSLQYFEVKARQTFFPEADIFAPLAAQLAKGTKPESLGAPTKSVNTMNDLMPIFDTSSIEGAVIYIDSFDNAISNISFEDFEKVGKGRNFEIFVQSYHYRIDKLTTNYRAEKKGDFVALFNRIGLLEVAQYMGTIASLLNLRIGSKITVRFHDKEKQQLTMRSW